MSSSFDHSRAVVRDTMSGVAWEATFANLDPVALGRARAVRSAPAELFGDHPDARPARVARVDRGRMLLVAAGDGALRHVHDRAGVDDPSVVGDWVLVDADVACARLPRHGTLARRRDTDSLAPQVLAAHIDVVLVAEALDPGRAINVARIARVVALAASGGAEVRVLLTGTDRLEPEAVDDLPADVAGAAVIATSIVDGRGLDELRDLLANALLGDSIIATSERRASGTGRHTPSVSRLVPLPSGALLIDTPGIRAVGMHAGVDVNAVASSAIGDLAGGCRFGDCRHDGEPGCAVEAAIEAGDLPVDAVTTWHKLEREALREQARVDDRLRRELGESMRRITKEVVRARRRGEIVDRRR